MCAGSADSSKTVTPEETPVRNKQFPHNEKEATNEIEKCSEPDKYEIIVEDEIDGALKRTGRSTSSPEPSEAASLQIQLMPTSSTRPLSTCSLGEGSGSELSVGETPSHRRVKEKLSNSPRISERPKVCVMCVHLPKVYSRSPTWSPEVKCIH